MSDVSNTRPERLSPAVALARSYLDALQAHDLEATLALLSDDFVLEVPLNATGTNDLSDSWHGLGTAAANFDIAFREIKITKFADIEITPGRDESVAFAECRGVMKMANGRPYENRYVFRFDVRDKKIRRIREYTNPLTGAVAFGMPLPQSTSSGLKEPFMNSSTKRK